MADALLVRPAWREDAALARMQVDSYRSAYACFFPQDRLDLFAYDVQEADGIKVLTPGGQR